MYIPKPEEKITLSNDDNATQVKSCEDFIDFRIEKIRLEELKSRLCDDISHKVLDTLQKKKDLDL